VTFFPVLESKYSCMPSRRAMLSALAAGAAGALAGCNEPMTATGYVQLKAVKGRRNGTTRDVIQVQLGEPESKGVIDGFVEERWADRFEDPKRPTVSAALHEDFESYYEEVTYLLGVCSNDWPDAYCNNASADREDFNRVQVYDEVRAAMADSGIEIYGVEGTWTFPPERTTVE
jgi:hypothetical protein